MTEEAKTNQRKWDESEAYFNKEFPDHEDGCLYGKIVVKAAYTAGVESREEYEKKLLLENIDQHNKIVFLSRKVQDLQKENAELKERLAVTNLNGNIVLRELTEAKEHIRTLISCLIDWVQEGDKDYCHIAEAEQFLKE